MYKYLEKRSTKADPNFFSEGFDDDNEDHKNYRILYNTSVTSVKYNDNTEKFEVEYQKSSTVSNVNTNERFMCQFDYCIWAAGLNGMPRIPRNLLSVLKTGGSPQHDESDDDDNDKPDPFKGTILHSSHMSKFDDAVSNKKIVLIGDGESAKGLAVQAVKKGVKKVYVLSRSGQGICSDTGSWPGKLNKTTGKVEPYVEVHMALPYKTINNGNGLMCNEMIWNDEEEIYELYDEVAPLELNNIDTVIFCTGYVPNQELLCTG